MAQTEQSRESLALANEIRFARARDKARIKDGTLTLADLLDRPRVPAHWRNAKLPKVLMVQPGLGEHFAASAMAAAGIFGARTLDELTARQRSILTAEVRRSIRAHNARERRRTEARAA
jgi:hypothetical protein